MTGSGFYSNSFTVSQAGVFSGFTVSTGFGAGYSLATLYSASVGGIEQGEVQCSWLSGGASRGVGLYFSSCPTIQMTAGDVIHYFKVRCS